MTSRQQVRETELREITPNTMAVFKELITGAPLLNDYPDQLDGSNVMNPSVPTVQRSRSGGLGVLSASMGEAAAFNAANAAAAAAANEFFAARPMHLSEPAAVDMDISVGGSPLAGVDMDDFELDPFLATSFDNLQASFKGLNLAQSYARLHDDELEDGAALPPPALISAGEPLPDMVVSASDGAWTDASPPIQPLQPAQSFLQPEVRSQAPLQGQRKGSSAVVFDPSIVGDASAVLEANVPSLLGVDLGPSWIGALRDQQVLQQAMADQGVRDSHGNGASANLSPAPGSVLAVMDATMDATLDDLAAGAVTVDTSPVGDADAAAAAANAHAWASSPDSEPPEDEEAMDDETDLGAGLNALAAEVGLAPTMGLGRFSDPDQAILGDNGDVISRDPSTGQAVLVTADGRRFELEDEIYLWDREEGYRCVRPDGTVEALSPETRAESRMLKRFRCHCCVNGATLKQRRSKWLTKCRSAGCSSYYCQTHFAQFSEVAGGDLARGESDLLADLLRGRFTPTVCLACRGRCCCSEGNDRCTDHTSKVCATYGLSSHKCEKVRHRVYNSTKRKNKTSKRKKRKAAKPSVTRPAKVAKH